MNVDQLGENRMLIHLSVGRCGVKHISNLTFHNLHSLDLSDNLLTEVSGYHFRHMPHLTALFLAGNPLSSVFMVPSGTSFKPQKIRTLGLVYVKLSLVIPLSCGAFPVCTLSICPTVVWICCSGTTQIYQCHQCRSWTYEEL